MHSKENVRRCDNFFRGRFQKGDAKTMCYLIAKKFSEPGCIAVQTEAGKALAGLVSYLGLRMLDKGVQILTISSPEAYG